MIVVVVGLIAIAVIVARDLIIVVLAKVVINTWIGVIDLRCGIRPLVDSVATGCFLSYYFCGCERKGKQN